jgi:TonB family protein
MASILVVGQEQRSLERFHRVLSAEGWRVRVAQGRAQALQAAALEPPDLVLAGAEVPGAEELASAFRRSAGGPGIVVVMGEGGSATGPAVLGDDRLRQPFGDQDLVAAVRRMLAVRREPGGQASTGQLPQTVRLTSQEIFGDVLAEVEGHFGGAAPAGSAGAPAINAPAAATQAMPAAGRSAGSPQALRPPAPPAAAGSAAAAASQPSRAPSRDDDDVARKLEKTLSGLLGGDPRKTVASPGASSSAASTQPSRRADPGAAAAGIEALLSKTLSELGARPRPAAAVAAPSAPAPAAPAAARPPASREAPATAPTAATPAPPATAPAASQAPPAPASQAPPAAASAPVIAAAAAAAAAAPMSPPARPAPPPPVPLTQSPAPAAAPPPAPMAPAASAPPPGPPLAAESTGARRRMTGELDLSQIEELARTRRKVEPSSRPGLASAMPAAASASPGRPAAAAPSPRTGSSPNFQPTPPTPPVPPNVGLPGARLGDDSPAATQRIQMVPREAREKPEPAGEKFGQYTLLERIAVGGMAEVWKARMRGVEGFQKTVAIKKILPYMTDNADFVSMFIDEAKLAAQLSHPNIIHIYDLGKIGSDFYIAMEYVEGKDLRSLLNAARQRGVPLPLGLALLIGMRVASALDYAHRKRDFEGHEMALVHRDVSPQNVLISYDGDVKLCDFGIAKAVSKVGQTQMGALKGKLQYMSPEQARGNQVDARSDIFSLGAVLFEMLTGQRLFDGDSEMSVLEAVRQVKVRAPRQVDPTVPRQADDIVMHALAGRPEDRYQTAGELEQQLENLLYSLKPSPSHSDLAAYVRRVLEPAVAGARADRSPTAAGDAIGVAGVGGRPLLRPAAPAAASVAAAVSAAAIPAVSAGPAAPAPAAPVAPVHFPPPAPPAQPSAAPSGAPPDVAPLAPLGEVRMEEGSRRSLLLTAAAAVVLVLAGLLTYFVIGRRNAAHPGGAAPAAAVAGAKTAGGPAAAAAGTGVASTAGQQAAKDASGAAGTPAAGKVDVQGVVDQEVARHAEELKKKLEEQQKQLQKEIDKTKSAKTDAAAATANPSANVPAGTAANVPPAGNGGETAAARSQQKPAATTATEPRATEAAANPAGTVPVAAASSAGQQEAARERTAEPAARPQGDTAGAGAASRAGAVGGGLTVPPKLVSTPKPEYPPLARKFGVQGVVVMNVLVDDQGRVEDVQLVERISQDVGINEAALQVARGARFKSATRDGVPIKMWTRLRIPFKL